MRIVTLVHISVIGVLAFVMLILIGSMLPPTGSAQSIGQAPIAAFASSGPDSPPLITDTRWLDLIRTSSAKSPAALFTLNIHLTDGFVAGRAPSGATVMISITRAGAPVLIWPVTPFPDGTGYLYVTSVSGGYLKGGGGSYVFQPGDVVWVTQLNTTISMTVPVLNGFANTTDDRVYGSAPISQPVTVYLYPFATPDVLYTQTATADANGLYQAIFTPTVDVRPRDSGYVAYAETPDRVAYARFIAPFLRAQVNGTELSGLAAPRSNVLITVTQANGTPRVTLSAHAGSDGAFEVYPDGWAPLQVGEHVVVTNAGQTFSMTVMTITAHADLDHHQVWGETVGGQPIDVLRFNGPVCPACGLPWSQLPDEQVAVTATMTGQYTASMSLARPNYGAVVMTMPDRHQVYARFAVPYVSLRMGTVNYLRYQATGQVDEPLAPITITIQGPSGYYKDVRHVTALSTGYFYDSASSFLMLDTGDIVTVTTPRGLQAAMTLPVLTGQIDPATDIVSGTAPPNTPLTLILYYYSIPTPPVPTPTPVAPHRMGGGDGLYTVIVTSTAQGDYQINLQGVIDLVGVSIGEVKLITADGHGVARVFGAIPQPQVVECSARLTSVYVGGSGVGLEAHSCSQYMQVTLRLLDALHHVKASQQWLFSPGNYWSSFSTGFYSGTQPILIVPGDVLELHAHTQPSPLPTPAPTHAPVPTPAAVVRTPTTMTSDQWITITVPLLTTQLDPIANAISGQAPAGTIVSLALYRDSYYPLRTMTATVNAQGAYTASLMGIDTIAPGDRARVSYVSGEPIEFYAMNVLPVLRAPIYGVEVSGWLPPYAPFTATIDSPRVITAVYRSYASDIGTMYANLPAHAPGDTIVVTTPQLTRRLTLPVLTARIDRAAATVYGQAPPNARLKVDLTSYSRSQVVTATADGYYTATFADVAPLSSAHGRLTYFDADGDQAYLEFATLYWEVTLDASCVTGSAEMAGAPVTVTLQSATGTTEGVFTGTTGYNGFLWACFNAVVQTGDQLTLVYPSNSTATFTVPLLSAMHDYAQQALLGRTIPDTQVEVNVWGSGTWSTRRVWSDANGYYGVDTSDLLLNLGTYGTATITDSGGNLTHRGFRIIGYPAYLPIMRK
jgi:hypothetical protein